MKIMASEVFKIVNNISPDHIHDLIKQKSSHYDFRNQNTAEVSPGTELGPSGTSRPD